MEGARISSMVCLVWSVLDLLVYISASICARYEMADRNTATTLPQPTFNIYQVQIKYIQSQYRSTAIWGTRRVDLAWLFGSLCTRFNNDNVRLRTYWVGCDWRCWASGYCTASCWASMGLRSCGSSVRVARHRVVRATRRPSCGSML